jgi:xanthine dehydrogenase accessory factor
MSAPAALPDWPLFGMTHDVRRALGEGVAAGRSAVLATLHTVVGGSPRPVGSQMLIAGGRLYGYLSGGCIEADVAAHAADVLRTGEPQRLIYGDGGPFPDIRLVCGGRIELLLERLVPEDAAVRALLCAKDDREPAIWASDGHDRFVWTEKYQTPPAGGLAERAATALRLAPEAVGARLDGDGAVAFRRFPERRMVVVGGDPTALAIASLALQSGFDTHLVRAKGPSEPPPLAGLTYHRDEPAAVLTALSPDPWTHIAVATHSLDDDEAALVAALASPAAYVGALGARRRLPERLARLRALGTADADLERLHAPIGLDLGGKAPFEIAVSVLAEVMAEANRRQPHLMVDVSSRAVAAA